MKIIPKQITLLVFFLLIPQFVGAVGSYFTISAIDSWYLFLNKPTFNPPNWIFGPVWTTLYLLMGFASFLVFQDGLKKKNSYALKLYSLQLALNLLWSIVFFGMQSITGGFLVIIILWIVILLTIIEFSKLNKTAGYLLLPYIAWVSFASFLNMQILILNK